VVPCGVALALVALSAITEKTTVDAIVRAKTMRRPRPIRDMAGFYVVDPFGDIIQRDGFRCIVEVGGFEPPSPSDRPGLLRAQPVVDLASRLPPAEDLSASPGSMSGCGPRAEP